MKTEIQILQELGSEAIQVALAEYTQWVFCSAVAWLFFAVIIWAWAITLILRQRKGELADEFRCYAFILLVIAAVTVGLNVPTILNPKAHAIHMLLEDARGK